VPAPPRGESRGTQTLPLFPLGTVLVPGMPLSLHIFEPRYRQLVADLLSDESPQPPVFGVVALRRGWEVGAVGDVHDVGTTARVTNLVQHPDGRCDLAAIGEDRFAIEWLDTASQPYLTASVRYLPEADGPLDNSAAPAVRRAWHAHLRALDALSPGQLTSESPELSGQALSYAVAQLPSLPILDRQLLLTCSDAATRLAAARKILRRETILLRTLRAVPATAATFRTGPS
jgi:Lon protease-like protein